MRPAIKYLKITASLLILAALISPAASEKADYENEFNAPYCEKGESPCIAGSNLLKSRDSLGTPEPHSPNTVDSATDGAKGKYQKDESIEDITVKSLENSAFSPGDTVEVSAHAYCSSSRSRVNFVYASNASSPSWTAKDSIKCGKGLQKFSTSFSTSRGDKQVFRAVIGGIKSGDTVGTGKRADNDDLVVNFDGSAPEISLVGPANGTVMRSGKTVNFSFKDQGSGVEKAEYSLDGSPKKSLSEPYNIETWEWEEGERNLTVYAEDRAGNTRNKNYSFNIDNSGPGIELLSPEEKVYDTKNVTLDYLVTDNSFVKHFYSINNSGFEGGSEIRELYPDDLIKAESPVGRQKTSHEVRFSIEKGSDIAGNSLNYISVDYGFSDVNISDLEATNFFAGLDTDQDGTVEKDVTGDISSLTKSGSSFTLTFNGNYDLGEEKTITLSYDNVANPSSGDYNVNVDINGDGSKNQMLEIFSSLSLSKTEVERVKGATNITAVEGGNRIKFFSLDKAGNLNSSAVEFEVDTTKPSVSLNSPSNGSSVENGTVIDLSVDDRNLDTVQYSLNTGENRTDFLDGFNVDTSTWENGENLLKVYANDTMGHMRSKRYVFNITDGDVPPSIKLNEPENKSVINGFDVLNFTISDTDLYAGYYSIEGSDFGVGDFVNSYDLNLSRSQAGEFELKIKAKDNELIRPEENDPEADTRHLVNYHVEGGSGVAGDSLNSVSVNYGWDSDVNFSRLDISDFSVGLDSDSDGIVDQNASSDISGLEKPESYRFKLKLSGNYNVKEGQNILLRYGDVENPTGGDYVTDVLVNGVEKKTDKLEISSEDVNNAVSLKNYVFTVDNTDPDLELFHPEKKVYGGKEVWLNYSSSDAHLDKTFYRLNSGPKRAISSNTTIQVDEGLNRLKVIANDSAGNRDEARRNFTVDTTPPEIEVRKPENKTYFQRDMVFSVSLNEEGSECSYSLDGSERKSMAKTSERKFERQVLNMDYGAHTVNFRCKDVVGNRNRTQDISFRLEEPELRYEPDFGAPYCASGKSPCDVNESFLVSRDSLGTPEPNSPNTVDSATDGAKGKYQKDGTIDSVYLRDYTAKTFSKGHTLEVTTNAYCGGGNDRVNLATASNLTDPSWDIKATNSCPGKGFHDFKNNITIEGSGDIAIRNLIDRKIDSTATEATSDWGENDDVVIPLDNRPPSIDFVSHQNNSVITSEEVLSFLFHDAEYNFDSGTFSIDGGQERKMNGTELNTSIFSEGEHSLRIYANDTAGNRNSKYYEITVDTREPEFRDLKQNKTLLNRSETVRLSAEFRDTNNLSHVKLATDETGEWENKTDYGSPEEVYASDSWKEIGFSWQNSSIYGEEVNWRLWANDTAGRTLKTPVKTFKVPNSRLRVWDDGDLKGNNETILITEDAGFYANFTDRESGDPINGSSVGCDIEFNNTDYSRQLGYGGEEIYEVDGSFKKEAVYGYRVFCNGSAQNYTNLEKTGDIEVEYVETDVDVEKIPESFKASYHRNVSFNTTLTCKEADCGSVSTRIRYNSSSKNPDTSMEKEETPFKIYSSNPKRCDLRQGEKCDLNWTVNVTGDIGDNYLIDVKSHINETEVVNRSNERALEIGEFFLTNLTFDTIDFGVLDPGKEDKPAEKNNVSGYNISIREYSNRPLDLQVKATDLESQKRDDYRIGVGNVSFSTSNSVSSEKQLSNNYQNLKSSLNAGESFDTFYWIDVPYGIYHGEYRGKIYFKSSPTQ